MAGCNLRSPEESAAPEASLTPDDVLLGDNRDADGNCLIPADWVGYTIQPGDALSAIAEIVGVRTDELAFYNCIENLNRIVVGGTLFVPPNAGIEANVIPDADGLAIYLIDLNEGGIRGILVNDCGDSARLQATPAQPSGDVETDTRALLQEMFALSTRATSSELTNTFEGTDVQLDSLSLSGDTITVSLSGTLPAGDRCTNTRREAQLLLNVFRFDVVQNAVITLNGRSLKQFFNPSATTIYTRADVPSF